MTFQTVERKRGKITNGITVASARLLTAKDWCFDRHNVKKNATIKERT